LDFEQIVSFVKSGVTGRTLMECAERSRTRLGIRGGLTRNLLLGKPNAFEDLLDAVDPFSDVDLVIEDRLDGMRVLNLIAASVPFAGFFHWELTTKEEVLSWLKHHPHFASDESVIWIDGRQGRAVVTVSNFGTFAGLTLDRPISEHDLRARFEGTSPMDLLLTYLKLLTILSRRPEQAEEIAFVAPFQRLLMERREQFTALDDISTRRMDLQLAKLFGASVELGRETAQLAVLSDLSERPSFNSPLLVMMGMFGNRTAAALGMWRLARIPYFRLTMSSSISFELGASGVNGLSFSLISRAPKCCSYKDFSDGPATVMWRGKSIPDTPLDRLTLTATVERHDTDDFYETSIGYGDNDGESIPIPNRISRRNGLIARMDPSFLGAALGRSVQMQVTVQEVGSDA
jgi:hypothetical protein